MHRYLWGQLRHRGFRALALLLGILVATTSFIVLTGTAQTSQLRTVGTVNANFRSAYDILVRPKISQTSGESRHGMLLRPNFLSGIYGGITLVQVAAVKRVQGAEVVAPIAMIGQLLETVDYPVDVTAYLQPAGRDIVRFSSRFVSRNGAAVSTGPAGYVYVTPAPLAWGPLTGPDQPYGPQEVAPTGRPVSECLQEPSGQRDRSPFDAAHLWQSSCWSRGRGDAASQWSSLGPNRYAAMIRWSFPVTLAAVDPQAEARLTGVDKAVVDGRFLARNDAPERLTGRGRGGVDVPVVASTRPEVDEQLVVAVDSLPGGAAKAVLAGGAREVTRAKVLAMPGKRVGELRVDAVGVLEDWLRQAVTNPPTVDGFWTAGQVSYTQRPAGRLMPQAVSVPESTWASSFGGGSGGFVAVPPDAADTSFRTLTAHRLINSARTADALAIPQLKVVGSFDPTKIAGYSPLSQVPLETYRAPLATAANLSTAQALGGKPLRPDLNPAGYLQSPPLLLTTMAGLRAFTDPRAFTRPGTGGPVSVIRVRVAGVTGADQVSRERVRVVAERIQRVTGLDVDITIGSSPAPRQVVLPTSKLGSPELTITEGWVKKGVAVAILKAVDRKSLLLFALILAVCALFVGNAAAAAVRARRTELGVLACLGWRTRKLFAAVLLEVGLVGLAAGVLGTLLALPLASAFGLAVSVQRAVLAVPAAVLLTLVAGLVPAWRASRSDPAEAVRPAVLSIRRARAPRTVVGLAVTNLVRTPGRSLVGALSLAVGVCALTLLLAVTLAFRGQLVGSLLGGAISVQIRGVDYLAASMTMLLGAVAVADVLYLNIRERSAEFATLRAIGWREGPLARLVTLEGTGMGLIGSVVGAAVGLAAAATFAGSLPAVLLLIATTAVVAGTAIAAAAAFLPATALRRLPTAQTLAEE